MAHCPSSAGSRPGPSALQTQITASAHESSGVAASPAMTFQMNLAVRPKSTVVPRPKAKAPTGITKSKTKKAQAARKKTAGIDAHKLHVLFENLEFAQQLEHRGRGGVSRDVKMPGGQHNEDTENIDPVSFDTAMESLARKMDARPLGRPASPELERSSSTLH